MDIGGKKTEKMHIRLTPEAARQVRSIADLEGRPYQDQMCLFINQGIRLYRAGVDGSSDESRRMVPQDAAFPEMVPPQSVAKRRTMPHRKQA